MSALCDASARAAMGRMAGRPCVFGGLGQAKGMFGGYRNGYILLIACLALAIAVSIAQGDSLVQLFDPRTIGPVLYAWLALPIFGWLVLLTARLLHRRNNRPLSVIWRLSLRHRQWLLRSIVLFLLLIPASRAFVGIKAAIPEFIRFYADPYFISADALIFGTDPWRLTHAIIGPIGTVVLDRIYLVWFVALYGLSTWLCFTTDHRLQVRGLLTFLLSWFLLGGVLATLGSSVGPVFYEQFYGDPRFAPLTRELLSQPFEIKAMTTATWMRAVEGENPFAAISAMPSLHVAIAFLLLIVVHHKFGLRWPALMAGTFFAAIFVGSIHLAWHYAVDGLVSVIGVSAIWWATGLFVALLDRQDKALPPVALHGAPDQGHAGAVEAH